MLSTLHVHLDHENCLEVVVLQGPTASVRQFADATMAETGVRHGQLHLVPTERRHGDHAHGHDHDHSHDPHIHLSPKS
jgi:CopG family nickel-responsive transcriptional regulator